MLRVALLLADKYVTKQGLILATLDRSQIVYHIEQHLLILEMPING